MILFHHVLLGICAVYHDVTADSGQEPQYTADFGIPSFAGNMTAARQLNRAIFNQALYSRVRETWFGDLPWGAKIADQASTTRWFTASGKDKAAFDKICYDDFHPAIEALSPSNFPLTGLSEADLTAPFTTAIHQSGDRDGLEHTKVALSLMILLDQIPRNLYRTNDTLRLVYEHYDRLAVALARHVISIQPRLDLHASIRQSVPFRQWFYMPLMHSEKLDDHRLFQRLAEEAAEEVKGDEGATEALETITRFEQMHVKIIERFGRYPHRHECLGREPTEDEREYMREGGQTFGVAG